jgi:hypothetical protein
VWIATSDSDYDLINDLWETNGVGKTLGFEVNSTNAVRLINQDWRGNWDHGWATSATVTNPPPDPYCNPYPGGYSAAAGYGICPRNEYDLTNSATAGQIRLKDWSAVVP